MAEVPGAAGWPGEVQETFAEASFVGAQVCLTPLWALVGSKMPPKSPKAPELPGWASARVSSADPRACLAPPWASQGMVAALWPAVS